MRAPNARCQASSGTVFSGFGIGSSGSAFSITGSLRKGHAPAIGAGVADPPLSRNLKNSRRAGRPLPRRCGRRVARLPAFQRSLIPARSLVPERFRGPVAPSAAEGTPLSPAPGSRDGRRMPETGWRYNDRSESAAARPLQRNLKSRGRCPWAAGLSHAEFAEGAEGTEKVFQGAPREAPCCPSLDCYLANHRSPRSFSDALMHCL